MSAPRLVRPLTTSQRTTARTRTRTPTTRAAAPRSGPATRRRTTRLPSARNTARRARLPVAPCDVTYPQPSVASTIISVPACCIPDSQCIARRVVCIHTVFIPMLSAFRESMRSCLRYEVTISLPDMLYGIECVQHIPYVLGSTTICNIDEITRSTFMLCEHYNQLPFALHWPPNRSINLMSVPAVASELSLASIIGL